MNIALKNFRITGKGIDSNTLQSDYFYVGSEGIVFENLYIPLEAVSVVKMLRVADQPLKPYLIAIGIGLLMCVGGFASRKYFLALVGLAVLLYGVFMAYSTWKENQQKVYKILLKINNGECYTMIYGNLNFTVMVVNKIRSCVAEKKESKNYFFNKGTVNYISDNSIGKVCDNIYNGNMGSFMAGINNRSR